MCLQAITVQLAYKLLSSTSPFIGLTDLSCVFNKTFNPEEAKHIVEMSDEKWKEMSKASHSWWKINASAMGLWNLTKNSVL